MKTFSENGRLLYKGKSDKSGFKESLKQRASNSFSYLGNPDHLNYSFIFMVFTANFNIVSIFNLISFPQSYNYIDLVDSSERKLECKEEIKEIHLTFHK